MSARFALLLLLCAALQGCMFRDVKEQQQRIATFCLFEGEVAAERREAAPLVVMLLRETGTGAAPNESWELADHFVLDGPGRWLFRANPGTYGLAAFQDLNRDLKYQPGEPFLRPDASGVFTCAAAEARRDIALRIPAAGRPRVGGTFDVAALQARTLHDQLALTLGQLTAVGEIAALSDARFAEAVAEDGLWRPFDFLFKGRPGVYFLEPYDARKIPVLFVHGINGTPANFRALMQLQHGFERFAFVAHSMGGLVSRGFLLRYGESGGRAAVPLFVTIATPWGGHKGAELGIKTAPVVVRVWVDMAPGSEYQSALFYADPATKREPRRLPAGTQHHLLFTFKQGSATLGDANDGVVTVSSQLSREAQRDGARLYGFNETHMSVLQSEEVSVLLNELLLVVPSRLGRN